MPYEIQETWRDASEDERDDHFAGLHPPCERCGVEVCRAATADPHDVDCICHQSIPGGIERDGAIFCGEVCYEAAGGGTPEPVEDEPTQPIPIVVGGERFVSFYAANNQPRR